MVSLKEVEAQLKAIGFNYRWVGRPEVVELQHILFPGEQINFCLNGRYKGGFATFVSTDQRILLVDKKLFYLTVEDMRYDMVSEVDYGAQLFSGTIRVCTPTKTLTFITVRPKTLRLMAAYIQQRVTDIRQRGGVGFNSREVLEGEFAPVAPVVASVQPTISRQEDFTNHQPYLTMLGNQAMEASDEYSIRIKLPMPRRSNPYINPPFMSRRRIGRFGPIGITPSKG